jgi:hypothetical protein
MISSIALAGSAEATAYVWGGASGNEYGQILEIWSQKDDVRISANESSPPASWIVSYTIPRRYLGSTFVGVKRSTTIRETWNSIIVVDDPLPVIAWGAKITDPAFKVKVIDICKRLRMDPNHLMACMYNESMLDPQKQNIKDGSVVAVGLIQFTKGTAESLHTSLDALFKMTAFEQLDYVENFFQWYRGRLTNVADLYCAMFCVFAIGQSDEFVCYAKEGVTHGERFYGPKFYEQNTPFDHNHDGKITKFEVGTEGRNSLAQGLLPANRG